MLQVYEYLIKACLSLEVSIFFAKQLIVVMTYGVISTCFWVVLLCGFSADVCLCGDITGLFSVHNCINNLHTSIMTQQGKMHNLDYGTILMQL